MKERILVRLEVFESTENMVSFERLTPEGRREWETYSMNIGTRRGLLRAIHMMCAEPWITPKHIDQLIDLGAKNPSKKV